MLLFMKALILCLGKSGWMKNKHKNTIKVIIVVVLLVKGLFSIQNVKAELTPDEQHLTGVEAHNLDNK